MDGSVNEFERSLASECYGIRDSGGCMHNATVVAEKVAVAQVGSSCERGELYGERRMVHRPRYTGWTLTHIPRTCRRSSIGSVAPLVLSQPSE